MLNVDLSSLSFLSSSVYDKFINFCEIEEQPINKKAISEFKYRLNNIYFENLEDNNLISFCVKYLELGKLKINYKKKNFLESILLTNPLMSKYFLNFGKKDNTVDNFYINLRTNNIKNIIMLTNFFDYDKTENTCKINSELYFGLNQGDEFQVYKNNKTKKSFIIKTLSLISLNNSVDYRKLKYKITKFDN